MSKTYIGRRISLWNPHKLTKPKIPVETEKPAPGDLVGLGAALRWATDPNPITFSLLKRKEVIRPKRKRKRKKWY